MEFLSCLEFREDFVEHKITEKHRLEFREEKTHKNTKTPSHGILRRLCVGDIGEGGGGGRRPRTPD